MIFFCFEWHAVCTWAGLIEQKFADRHDKIVAAHEANRDLYDIITSAEIAIAEPGLSSDESAAQVSSWPSHALKVRLASSLHAVAGMLHNACFVKTRSSA